MKKRILFTLLCLAAFCGSTITAQTVVKEPTAEIAGRVTVGGKPLAGVRVMLGRGEGSYNWKNTQRTVTDQEGSYHFTKIAAGDYTVIPHAPSFVLPLQGKWGQYGKSVTLKDGETVADFDFKLIPGGIITGRVSDAANQPVMEQGVRLELIGDANSPRTDAWRGGNWDRFNTDDRGVYRIYGLPPGKYLVSFGADKDDKNLDFGVGSKGGYYERTFYPGVKDKNDAKIVELTEGAEAAGVDIKLGERAKSFAVSGLVTDAATNKPLPRISIGFGNLTGKRIDAIMGSDERSDAQGRFRMEGVKPGHYAVFPLFWGGEMTDDRLGEPVEIDITDRDLTDLELKVTRGASVSGLAVLEGVTDPNIQAQFAKFKVGAYTVAKEQLAVPSQRQATPGPNGAFRLAGFGSGRAKFYLAEWPRPRGFVMARVEHDGVPVGEEGLAVKTGEDITGVRLVFTYNTGRLRGQVEIINGSLAEGVQLSISARRLNPSGAEEQFADPPDARYNFVVEGLSSGEYEIVLRVIDNRNVSALRELPVRARQRVTVTDGVEAEVKLTLDLSKNEAGGKP